MAIARRGNPNPSQDAMLRAQAERRDAHIERQAELLRVYVKLAEVVIADHEKRCDCDGEACATGLALKRVREVLATQERTRKRREGVWPPR